MCWDLIIVFVVNDLAADIYGKLYLASNDGIYVETELLLQIVKMLKSYPMIFF